MNRTPRLLAVAWLAAQGLSSLDLQAGTSPLWGTDGKSWSPASRLPDFSYAGYGAGDKAIPDRPIKADVRDFGAVGDGMADDTAAFLKAIAAVENGVVFIPAGRYRITRQLDIRKPNLVIRGAGEDKTILFFPLPLQKMVGNAKSNSSGGSWSWSGGVIAFTGRDRGILLTKITAPAKRGGRRLRTESAAKIIPGQWVRVVLTDRDGSLARHLHAEQAEGSKDHRGKKLVDFSARVTAVDENGTVILNRPLRTDVRPEWEPALYGVNPSMEEVGVEYLTVEFPEVKYVGHHIEPGYNAVAFEGVRNCWARHLRITNADSGIFFRERTKFCTAHDLQFTAGKARIRIGYGADTGEPRTMPVGGHHGILFDGYSQDNLAQNFRIELRFLHDIGVSAWAAGNVYSNGYGIDMDLDHHRRAPYENLFTEIQVGEGSRLWQNGGDRSDGPPAGARETFWNIRADRPQTIPGWAIQGNFEGITESASDKEARAAKSAGQDINGTGNWWNTPGTEQLTPKNLYSAQRAARQPPPKPR